MAFTTTPGYPKSITAVAKQILPADTTTKVTVLTAGADGMVIQALGVTSTDTSARYVSFYMTIGATDYLIGSINVNARAGDITSVAVQSVLNSTSVAMGPWVSRDSDGNKVLRLPASAVLKAAAAVTITAAKEINIIGYGASY